MTQLLMRAVITVTGLFFSSFLCAQALKTDEINAAALMVILGGQNDGEKPDLYESITVSRQSGVAPLMVHFSADFSNATSESAAGFHYYDYSWDFGDPNSGNWGTTGKPRNKAKGPVTGHVFEEPGLYTVELLVRDFDGVIDRQTFEISVQDPDIVFAGKKTIVVNPAGDDDFSEAPAGAHQISTDNLSDVTRWVFPGTRVLFKRGARWALTTQLNWPNNAGPVQIGAYGLGDHDMSGRYTNAPEFRLAGGIGFLGLSYKKNWNLMDLSFVGDGTGGVLAGSNNSWSDNLLLRLSASNFSTSYSWFHSNTPEQMPIQNAGIVDCKGINSDLNGVYIGGERVIFMGNEIADVKNSHVMRMWQGYKSVLSNNKLSGSSIASGTGREALKFHGPGDEDVGSTGNNYLRERTAFSIISDNIFGGSNPWPVSIQPQNRGSFERISNIIFERNRYIYEYGSESPLSRPLSSPLIVMGVDVTVRNNVIDGTGNGWKFYGVSADNVEGLVATRNVMIYNNTFLKGDSISASTLGSNDRKGVVIANGAENCKVFNNVFFSPNVPGSNSAVVADNGVGTQSRGNVFSENISLLVDPDNINPTLRNYAINLASASADFTAYNWGMLLEDFNNEPRRESATFVGAVLPD